jgi:hypothetical protein
MSNEFVNGNMFVLTLKRFLAGAKTISSAVKTVSFAFVTKSL